MHAHDKILYGVHLIDDNTTIIIYYGHFSTSLVFTQMCKNKLLWTVVFYDPVL